MELNNSEYFNIHFAYKLFIFLNLMINLYLGFHFHLIELNALYQGNNSRYDVLTNYRLDNLFIEMSVSC